MICIKERASSTLHYSRNAIFTERLVVLEIRTILLALDPRASSASDFGAAIDLAQKFGARVSVCAAAQPWLPSGAVDTGPAVVEDYERRRREIEEALGALEAGFESTVPTALRGRYRGLIASATDFMLQNMAFADLVLLPSRGGPGDQLDIDAGELIVAGGRPVLVIPQDTVQIRAENIIVAWKDTRESRRAVADALPFLKAATDVYVVDVEEDDYATEHESFKDVMAWLAAHGVKATGDIIPLRTTVHDAIEAAAADHQAEFIVSGGYGHTRFREWLFGGVTRDLLTRTARCRFLSN